MAMVLSSTRCRHIGPLLLSAAIVASSRRGRFRLLPPTTAMSTSSSSSSSSVATNNNNCGGGSRSALIFLHGLGDSPAGWSSLEDDLPSIRERLGDVHYVFPPAPTIGLTINGGLKMPGWFDLYDWPIGISARDDKDGMLAAVEQIETTVETLEREMGIPPSRVVIGGFSQGGAVALVTAYHRRRGKVPFAGCVCLSGWLTLKDDLTTVTEDVANATPLFWGHGKWDDKVLFEQQAHGVGRLRELGMDVTDESYPMGHSSHPKELGAVAEFLERVLFTSR
ncbi:hypothetical protein ACHAXA_006070 [Cyclostephanos tholiformis]|uniref:Phospholipase/carboxylesterase/thioesterase domain-containing protein n=1 Tax=Cyclostephanos tholiformis TaxID=382380 RepID=A0ABD3SB87_9STRA